MKKLKKVVLAVLLVMVLPISMILAGCSLFGKDTTSVYIVSIEKTETSTESILEILYSNGETETIKLSKPKDGKDGKDGRSVVSINQSRVDGLVVTYTITYSDGTSSTFNVTNGEDGIDGRSITSIVPLASTENGVVDNYRINFSDGEYKDFSVRNGRCIDNIELTDTNGLIDTYTITFSDGTISTFDITNGEDGKDGENGKDGKDGVDGKDGEDGSFSIQDAYEKYVETYGEISYDEFLAHYLGTNDNAKTQTINNCLLSTLRIFTEFREDSSTSVFGGSAVVYKIVGDDAYVLTNFHVVYHENASEEQNGGTKFARNIYGYLYGSEDEPVQTGTDGGFAVFNYGDYGIKMELVGASATCDIAVLKVPVANLERINPDIKAVKVADEYYVGQTVFAIGDTRGNGISVAEGVVSVDSEYIALTVDGTLKNIRTFRFDAYINHGNSGGGLFNLNGELVGITNSGYFPLENNAIPIENVVSVAESIIYHENDSNDQTNGAYKIAVGINVIPANSKFVLNAETGLGKVVEDIYVSNVNESGIAHSLGIEVGDVLRYIMLDDVKYELNRSFNLLDIFMNVRVGTNVVIGYERETGEVQETAAYTVQISDMINV